MSQTTVKPPLAKKVRHEMNMFNDLRVDNYYWLRDDSLSDPQVLSYLEAENNYTDRVMSDSKQLEDQIYGEIRGRIKEDDISEPVQQGTYCYYERYLKGKAYAQYCRRSISNGTCNFVESNADSYDEQVILDVNIKAMGYQYYSIDIFKVHPNNKLVAYAEDTIGNENYTIYIMDIDSGNLIGKPLKGASNYMEWAGDDTLIYITIDETFRTNKVLSHKIMSDQSSDVCLFNEKNITFYLYLYASENREYIFVVSSNLEMQSFYYLNVSRKENDLHALMTTIHGGIEAVSHRGNHFFMLRTNEELYNSELVACPVNNLTETTILLQHCESVQIESFQLFSGYIVVFLRENGLKKINVYRLPAIGEIIGPLYNRRSVDFIGSINSGNSVFSSNILRFYYTSLKTPRSLYEYNMESGTSVLIKMDTVLGGFNASNYVTTRKWAENLDCTRVPITLLYRKNLVKFDGSNPLLLDGYGGYGISFNPTFDASKFSLVDRGFIYAIAHVRGGADLGTTWYEEGKFLKKRNSFHDFIASAEYLIENRYTSKDKICINGVGSGGLLTAAVINMRPDLFKAAITQQASLDLLTRLLDPTIPRTTMRYQEYGDPRKEEYYFYIKSFSPIDNIKAQDYPNILVRTDLYNSRAKYYEAAKYVAKMRATKIDKNMMLFICDLRAGHSSMFERFEGNKETALIFTFILKTMNMTDLTISS